VSQGNFNPLNEIEEIFLVLQGVYSAQKNIFQKKGEKKTNFLRIYL
jgi:hypothetical protein